MTYSGEIPMDNILYRRMFPNFRPSEFHCPCGNPLCAKENMDYPFLFSVQDWRTECEFPFKVNSGYRCSAYNATLPDSVPDSWHCQGLAVDISTKPLNATQKHILLEGAFKRFTGIGIYKTFIHVDKRPRSERAVWVG